MPVLPVGFFMPLPLPIMIPFMMWQSAAIAAGFGTYFQFAKRRVSAMSNEDFNKADPHELVNFMYEDIVKSIPSSFAKVDSLTPVILQSMNVMLDQAVKWLAGVISGNVFGTPNPVNEGTGVGDDLLPDPTSNLITLSLSEISNANDLVLSSWIRNIRDYTLQTQQWLVAEQARRSRTGTPAIEPPSPAQQTTKLNPQFVATLSQKDLETGGSRVRNYKGQIQKWIGIRKVILTSSLVYTEFSWSGKWVSSSKPRIVVHLQQADSFVNKLKLATQSSYVLVFGRATYYLIKDNF